jgi:hypothetical protein
MIPATGANRRKQQEMITFDFWHNDIPDLIDNETIKKTQGCLNYIGIDALLLFQQAHPSLRKPMNYDTHLDSRSSSQYQLRNTFSTKSKES